MAAETVRAGWAAATITPTIPCWMGGYGDRTAPADAIHDPLYANALALGDPTAPLIVVICDLVAVDASLVARVRERVAEALPGAVVWLGATHTHSGPDVGRIFSTHEPPPEVTERIVAGATDAAREAARAMRTVRAAWASGSVEGVASNRDHPDSGEEITLDLLCLYADGDSRGVPSAVFGSFPCHPTVLSAANYAISADLPGAYRRQLRARLGTETWVALATGAAGDISTRHLRQGQGFEELERLGRLLAEAAERFIATAEPLRLAPPIVREDTVALKRKDPLDMKALASDADTLSQQRAAALEAGNIAQARTLETVLQGIRAAQHIGSAQQDLPLPSLTVATARLGELALVAIPGELYSRLGAEIRRGAASPALVLGYTNGYVGYIPTREAYQSLDYEVLMSQFGAGSGEDVAAAALRMLRETKAGDQ
ncbi:MAG TPA: neutral/alkaline non-lysosomal ceramidase N-terminal domain-containing protein [Ktedonobacterales bacterium]